MPDFIYGLPDVVVFWILIGFTTTVSVLLVLINKRLIFRKLRYRDNATIGSISALIGIIYGVLVGFIALYLINNNDAASNSVQREANAAANVYLYSQWLKPPIQGDVQKDLRRYIDTVIHQEWPAMKVFKPVSQEGDLVVRKMFNDLKPFAPKSPSETIVLQNSLTEITNLYNARQERINISTNTLSPELWEVVLVGTILIIAINYAFRVSLYLHLFSTTVFAIMAASMLFLLITMDRPFQGEFVITPDAFQSLLDLMDKEK